MAEKLRTKFLSDAEAQRLYRENPKLKASPDTYCPTCSKTGTYFWNGQNVPCDCEMQLQLHKHYLAAGIGLDYQILNWGDYAGDPEVNEMLQKWMEKREAYLKRGAGLVFTGNVGRGKTLAATLVLKDLVKLGYSCYSVTFASMIEMFTAGWRDKEEQKHFQQKIRMSDVLLLDDLGRELRAKSKLSEATFDDVLRSRSQSARSTFITTNMDMPELLEGYGSGALSLLSEKSLMHTFTGSDFRSKANTRLLDEVDAGIVRPIF